MLNQIMRITRTKKRLVRHEFSAIKLEQIETEKDYGTLHKNEIEKNLYLPPVPRVTL